jgi:hypothetical protein
MKAEIELATAGLRGKALWRCLRAADMATFDFGKRRRIQNAQGEENEVGEYALHVQCAWRIIQNDRVIIGDRDLYYPADYRAGAEIPDEFDWDHNPNRRDRLTSSFFEDGKREFVVKEINTGEGGILHIMMSEGYSLQIFPDSSLPIESWRLFKVGQRGHFVVSGTGLLGGGMGALGARESGAPPLAM